LANTSDGQEKSILGGRCEFLCRTRGIIYKSYLKKHYEEYNKDICPLCGAKLGEEKQWGDGSKYKICGGKK
jgi:hypothetical protein